MSSTSGPPPSASQIHAKAMTAMQDITIRLLKLPDILQTNAKPVKLTGTVIGQNPDGSVQLSTDRGVITMMMKDKGSLQPGQKFEIEIPAGRPPQQAALRTPPAQTTQPHPSAPLPPHSDQPGQPPLITVYPPSVKLERPPSLKQDDLAEALAAALPENGLRPPAAPLAAGQILRLTPLPMTAPNAETGNFPIEITPETILKTLINSLEQAADLPDNLHRNFMQILSRANLPSLLSQIPKPLQVESQKLLEAALQKLTQDIDDPELLRFRNAPFQNTGVNLPPTLNLTKPIDAQILGFQPGNFQSVLNTSSPSQIPQPVFTVIPELPKSMATPTAAMPLPANAGTAQASTGLAAALPAQTQPSQPVLQTPQLPPAAQPPRTSAPPPLAAPVLIGQVKSFTPQGQPIIALTMPGSAHPQNYAVQFIANNIVEGATVIVTPLPVTHSTQPGIVPFAIGANQPLSAWAQPEIWEPLQTLIATLHTVNPAAAQAVTQMLPNASMPQNMGALSLLFLSMMRAGDLDGWVGKPADLLRQAGKIEVLRALSGESAVSNRLEQTVLPGEWRAAMLPFWNDGQVHKLPVYYKQWQDETGEEDRVREQRRMRFLFNLKLSRMGDVQVDGFLQKEKLDMILRTKAAMSIEMQQAMKITYTRAMERSNLAGEISFQFKPEQWVNVEMPV